jgi:RNA polymerase sigma-70 factor
MIDSPAITQVTDAAWQNAVQTHGDLGLPQESYKARLLCILLKCIGDEGDVADALRAASLLHTGDLYLAQSCAWGFDCAWQRLRTNYRKYATDLFRWMDRASKAEESAESLFADLFLPDQSGSSRIGSYDGRSSLMTWLRVVISNRLINERQRAHRGREWGGELPEVPDRSALETLEDRLRTDRYLPAIRSCLKIACRRLSRQERLMLLWRFEDEMQLGDIARLTSIHQSTVTRQIDRTLRRMRSQLESLLATEFGMTGAAIQESLLLLVRCNAESLSVLRFIRQAEAAAHPIPVRRARQLSAAAAPPIANVAANR